MFPKTLLGSKRIKGPINIMKAMESFQGSLKNPKGPRKSLAVRQGDLLRLRPLESLKEISKAQKMWPYDKFKLKQKILIGHKKYWRVQWHMEI